GFVLARRPSPRLTEIYAKAVAPRYRRSPADLLLMLAHIDSDPTFTSRVIRFQSHDHHRATDKFAARVAATPLAVYLKLRAPGTSGGGGGLPGRYSITMARATTGKGARHDEPCEEHGLPLV